MDNGLRTSLRAPSHCASCRRPLGATAFVSHGRLGVYIECEWCYTATPRPVEPELITDAFRKPAPTGEQASLDLILDKLTGETRA